MRKRGTFVNAAIKALAGMAVSLSVASCAGNDGTDEPRYATLYDVVEYTGQTEAGTVFTLYTPDADEAVTLTSTRVIDAGDTQPGECVLLAYVPADGEAYRSGNVDVTGMGVVTNDFVMKGSPESLAGWDADPVWLTSLWRAGGKVLMRLNLVYDAQPRVFRLVVDENTIGDEYPEAYLVNIRRNDTENYMHQYYVAFDVHALWTYSTCKGLRIHVNNSNNPALTEFVVEKPLNYTSGSGNDIPDTDN